MACSALLAVVLGFFTDPSILLQTRSGHVAAAQNTYPLSARLCLWRTRAPLHLPKTYPLRYQVYPPPPTTRCSSGTSGREIQTRLTRAHRPPAEPIQWRSPFSRQPNRRAPLGPRRTRAGGFIVFRVRTDDHHITFPRPGRLEIDPPPDAPFVRTVCRYLAPPETYALFAPVSSLAVETCRVARRTEPRPP